MSHRNREMVPIRGQARMPWQLFTTLPRVRELAPSEADRASLRDWLQSRGLTGPEGVDLGAAGGAILGWQQQRSAGGAR